MWLPLWRPRPDARFDLADEAGADQPVENSLGYGARNVQPVLQEFPGDHRIWIAHDSRHNAADELGASCGIPAIHIWLHSNVGACMPELFSGRGLVSRFASHR